VIIADAASALGGFGFLLLFLVVLVVGVVWVIFPFFVASGLNSIEKALKRQTDLLEKIVDRQNETNKALQFLVDDRGGFRR